MKAGAYLIAIMSVVGAQAQPGPFLQADLQFAVNVCSDTVYTTSMEQTGMGAVADLDVTNHGCQAGNERQSVWMHFTLATSGKVGFTVLPSLPADYDFGVWGPFVDIPQQLAAPPIRCSYSALYGAGGLNYTEVDLTEGAGGSGWVRFLDVQAGERYALLINNFSMNGINFSLTFDLQDGATLECLPPTEAGFEPSALLIQPGGSVNFTDLSTNYPYGWWWEFPGGLPVSSVEQDPQGITYGLPGCYDVMLTAFNAAGESISSVECQVEVELTTGMISKETGHYQVIQDAGSITILPSSSATYALRLIDITGRELERRICQGEQQLLTTDLPGGTFIMVLEGTAVREARRIINTW